MKRGRPRITLEVRRLIRRMCQENPTWRSFPENHSGQTAAIDAFTVPTLTFRLLYCLTILDHRRRRIVHFNVTKNPTSEWTTQQVIEAFPYDEAPRAPWQNPYVERVIGSIRRECLDHMIIFSEDHLRRVMAEYVRYYNESWTHMSLGGDSPIPRKVEPPSEGDIVAVPFLGGLHHRYTRAA